MNLNIDQNGVLSKYSGNDEVIEIPENVKEIGENAFSGCGLLKEIIIPSSVTEIGNCAFYNCSSLEKVVIHEGVKTIGEQAFFCCESLKEINIPSSVTKIGDSAFSSCKSLKDERGFVVVNGILFGYFGEDETVVISDGVTEIGCYAFWGYGFIKEIIIPSSVKTIGHYVFGYCTSLKEAIIPGSVTEIGEGAFSKCSSLEKVVISEGVKTIGERAFDYCESLKEITIPGSVTEIGHVFSGCSSLEKVIIQEGVKIIVERAFDHCTSLKEAIIPGSVTEMGDSVFLGCKSLKEIIIPGSVTVIGEGAFSGCSSLEKVVIQEGVKTIEERAFIGCESLKEIIIPNSVTVIKYGAFSKCLSLEKVVIKEGVKRIGEYAFHDCESLKEINIPGSVTEIGRSAFYDCSSLEKVVIQEGVKTIGDSAFLGCKSLKEIIIPSSVTEIGYSAFYGCESLKEVIIPDGVTTIGRYTFSSCKSLKEIIIPGGVTEIGEGAFSVCSSLEKVFINEGVKRIVEGAFDECKFLKEINISEDIEFNTGKYKACKFGGISDGMNAYVNTMIKALLYFDSINELRDLNYKTDICNYPNIIIRDHEDIKLTDEERKIILSELKKSCNDDDRLYIALAFFADDDTVNELVDDISIWMKGKKKDKERIMRVKGALLLNDTVSAQKYFEKIDKLDIYAKRRDLDVDDLQDQLLSDFGLDHNGKTEYILENNTITASLQNDLKFILTDETGKVIKSISKKTDKGIKASEEYSKLKKDVIAAAKMINNKLFKDFLSGKKRDGKAWRNAWLNNPVMKIMARLIVWQQNDNTFTLHDDNKAYLVDNTPYEISNEPIRVAHPLEMKEDELIKWRQYFIDNSIRQPFEQVWEPVSDPNSIKPDRYKDAYIPLYAIMNKDKHGIIMNGQSKMLLKDCSAKLELIESHADWINNQFEITNFRFDKYTRNVNHIVNIFDKGTVEGRIKKDDISVSIYLDRFTLAQITDFIDIATKNKCTNVSALLLQYKHDHYPDYDHIDELILDL